MEYQKDSKLAEIEVEMTVANLLRDRHKHIAKETVTASLTSQTFTDMLFDDNTEVPFTIQGSFRKEDNCEAQLSLEESTCQADSLLIIFQLIHHLTVHHNLRSKVVLPEPIRANSDIGDRDRQYLQRRQVIDSKRGVPRTVTLSQT